MIESRGSVVPVPHAMWKTLEVLCEGCTCGGLEGGASGATGGAGDVGCVKSPKDTEGLLRNVFL